MPRIWCCFEQSIAVEERNWAWKFVEWEMGRFQGVGFSSRFGSREGWWLAVNMFLDPAPSQVLTPKNLSSPDERRLWLQMKTNSGVKSETLG